MASIPFVFIESYERLEKSNGRAIRFMIRGHHIRRYYLLEGIGLKKLSLYQKNIKLPDLTGILLAQGSLEKVDLAVQDILKDIPEDNLEYPKNIKELVVAAYYQNKYS